MQGDSLCFNRVIVRIRRDASKNVELATIPSTSRPFLSLTTNMPLESRPDQANVSSRHNASLHMPASELLPNSTLLPANVTKNMTDILDILEASTFCHCYTVMYCTFLKYLALFNYTLKLINIVGYKFLKIIRHMLYEHLPRKFVMRFKLYLFVDCENYFPISEYFLLYIFVLLPVASCNAMYKSLFVMQDENHRYYRSRMLTTDADDVCYYWVSEETMYEAETHGTLSESYRSAVVSIAVLILLLLSCAKSHMLSASRRQPHLLHVSAVDRRQTWSMDKS